MIDPKNPETVYVASPGHLFGPNPERGIYKTTDGGKTWNKVKFIDDDTGFTDIAIDPSNTNILYAASYQRRRSGCCFNGGGPGSALWKTTDAGKTWTKLTGNGLPPGTYGRIALDVSRSNPNVVYVQIEAADLSQPDTAPATDPGESDRSHAARRGGGAVAGRQRRQRRSRRGRPVDARAATAGWPARRRSGCAAGRGRRCAATTTGATTPARTRASARGRGGQPAAPNQTPPAARSSDAAASSDPKTRAPAGCRSATATRGRCTSASFASIRATTRPSTSRACRSRSRSTAARRSRRSTTAGGHGEPGHVDQHAIWIDPKNPKHIMIGNDGGLNISWDQGKTWDFVNTMATSLAYWVSADMRRPYYVYIGLQDNGSWGGPSATRSTQRDPELGLVRHRRRRRLPDGRRSDRLQHRLHRVAGREHQPLRPAHRPRAEHPSARAAADAERRRWRDGGGREPAATAHAAAADVGGHAERAQRAPPAISTASTGTRRSCCRRTIRASSGSAATGCSSRYNRGDTWVASADLTKQIDRNDRLAHGRAGRPNAALKNDGVVVLQHDHLGLGIAGRCLASSGPAPTTATCR